MPPEYIERYLITPKYDVFSLGVILMRIMAGDEGYSKCAHMSSQEFLEHVWEISCIMNKKFILTNIIISVCLTFHATICRCVQLCRYMKTGKNGCRKQ